MKILCLILGLMLVTACASAQDQSDAYSKGMAAYKTGAFETYEKWMTLAHEGNKQHDLVTFEYIRALWLNGKTEEARRLADLLIYRRSVMSHQLQSPEFSGLLNDSLSQRIAQLRRPVIHSDTAHVLTERGLIPEGIAIDKSTGIKYVGSLYRRKIIAISTKGLVSDFSHASDSLWSVLGMEVDEKNGVLWAASAYPPYGKNSEHQGCSRLLKIDLKSGRVQEDYSLCGDLLNDVTIFKGQVFVTGTFKAIVYRYDHREKRLVPWLDLGKNGYASLNGITIGREQERLYISHETGLIVAKPETAEWKDLGNPLNLSLLGIDGLAYYKNGLIAHQKMLSAVTWYRLNEAGDKVLDYHVVDANHPAFDSATTGEMGADGCYYYLANAQIKSAYAAPGVLRPYYELKDKLILKWKPDLH